MPRVLIAGCGYVGTAAAHLFTAEGWNVTAWTRSGNISGELTPPEIDVHAVELSDAEDVRRNHFDSDVVVHCAATGGGGAEQYRRLYRDGVQNLAAAFPNARLIFTSSTTVYPQRDGSWVDENSPAEPAHEKGRILRDAEQITLAAGGIVLRFGGIYGPGRSFLVRSVLNGSAALSNSDRYINQIHRDDAASAIFFLANRPDLSGPQIFSVVDNAPARRNEVLAWLTEQLGRAPLPRQETAAGSNRAETNKRVSNARLRASGWSPRFGTYQQGLQDVLSSWRI